MSEATTTETGAKAPLRAPAARGSGNRLLWIVAGVFALLLIAWTTLIVIACRHPVEPVPIAAPGGGGR